MAWRDDKEDDPAMSPLNSCGEQLCDPILGQPSLG